MDWICMCPREALGLIPSFLSEFDPRPAKEQFDANYYPGWRAMSGMTLDDDLTLHYPGDPPFTPLAMTRLRGELIVFYTHEIVAVIQQDHSFEAARLD